MVRQSRSLAAVGVALACTSLAACTYYDTPPPQPEPQALRVTAQRNQSQRQQDQDSNQCQSMASAQATSSASWAQIFTACMGGRGYMVE